VATAPITDPVGNVTDPMTIATTPRKPPRRIMRPGQAPVRCETRRAVKVQATDSEATA